MNTSPIPLYDTQLKLIAAMTEALNEHVPADPDFYLDIRLRGIQDDRVYGTWTDEIGPDCWAFQLITDPQVEG